MIVEFIQNNISILLKHKLKIKLLILAFSGILLFQKPEKISFMSFESCFDTLDRNINVISEKEFEPPIFLKERNSFIIKPKNDTKISPILIVTKDVEFWAHKISKLKIRTRAVEVAFENKKEKYFLKIFLKNDQKMNLVINPFGFQPISEIYNIALKIFAVKFKCDVFDCDRELENRISIEIPFSKYREFLVFLRIIMNFHSHYYGIYFYFPFKDGIIKGDKLAFFSLAISLYLLYDCDFSGSPFLYAFSMLLFYCHPVTFIFFYRKKRAFLYSILLSTIDLKCGFLYSFGWFVLSIFEEIENFKRIFNQKKIKFIKK